ncbi:MAG: GNAT family N-acetyltransferase [Chlamydiota bacterium]
MSPAPSAQAAPEHFETARLRAYRLRPEHFALLLAMHQDPVTMATLGGVRSEEQTRDYLQRFLRHWDENGFGMWLLYDREQQFVGRAALRRMELGGQMEVEVGCALLARFWRQGLASEIVGALLQMALERLGLPDLVGFALPENRPSIRILEKLGFGYEKDVEYAGKRHVLYRLTLERFAALRRTGGFACRLLLTSA